MRSIRAIAALIAVAISGCGENVPMRGVVVKKNHRPSWVQTMLNPVFDGDGRLMYFTQIDVVHPEQWDIVVRPDGTDDATDDVLVVVTERRWDGLSVGGVWERGDTVMEVER